MAVYPNGSFILTGGFEGTSKWGEEGKDDVSLSSLGKQDVYITKFNSNGSLVWAKHAGGIGWDRSRGIAVNKDGSFIIAGEFENTITFGEGESNEISLTPSGISDVFLAKYDIDGSLIWAKQAGGPENDDFLGGETPIQVVVDDDNSIFIIGEFVDTAIFGQEEKNETSLMSEGHNDIFIAKYKSDGTIVWAKRAGSNESSPDQKDTIASITIHEDGSAIVTGYFPDSATIGQEEDVIQMNNSKGMFLIKFNSDGKTAWTKSAIGNATGKSVEISRNNSIYAIGGFGGGVIWGENESNETTLHALGEEQEDDPFDISDEIDIFIGRFRADGSLSWVKRLGGIGFDIARNVNTLDDSSVLLFGRFEDIATFGNEEPNKICKGKKDFIAKYNSNGILVWAEGIGSACLGDKISLVGNDTFYVLGVIGSTINDCTLMPQKQNEIKLTSNERVSLFVAKFTF